MENSTTLPARTKYLYAMGYVPDVIMANLISLLANMIYNVELGVPATLIGLAVSLPRLWEAFTDPIIGNLSDNSRSRWGRRRPFIAVGAVTAGLLCMALWMPPTSLGKNGLFVYFLVISILYLTAYAAYNVPYLALGLEMAKTDKDRNSLMGFRVAGDKFAWFAILAFVPVLVTNKMLGETPVESVKVLGIILGVLIIGLGLLAAFTCSEGEQVLRKKSPGVLVGLKDVVKNKSFLMVAGIMCFALIGFVLAFTFPYYINLAVVFPGGGLEAKEAASEISAISTICGNLLAIAFCPYIGKLSEIMGRKQLLITGLLVLIASFLATPLLFNPNYPYLQILYKVVDAPAISIVWVLTLPMLAEVCDLDEIENGSRREGIFTAMFNWGNKFSMAFVSILGGSLIDFSGFKGSLVTQSQETITFLRWVFMLGPLPFLIVAIILTIKFPLNSKVLQNLKESKKTSC